MTDDVKAAVERFHTWEFDGLDARDHATLLAHLDGEPARTAAAVAAAREEIARRVTYLVQYEAWLGLSPEEGERLVGELLGAATPLADRIAELDGANHYLTERLDATGDLLEQLEKAEAENVKLADANFTLDRNTREMQSSLDVVVAERDALRDRLPTCEELEYARAMVLLKQRHEDPLGDDLSDHVYRLMAQAEVARKMANDAIFYGDKVDAPNLLAAMDEAAK